MSLASPIVAITADGVPLEAEVHGAKAVGLQQLARSGLPVPPALVLTVDAVRHLVAGTIDGRQVVAALEQAVSGWGSLAVRSGAASSLPGAFDSLIGVEPDDLMRGVMSVASSGSSDQAAAVAEAMGWDNVPPTAVIVQRMVDTGADEASGSGVANSRDPVTGRRSVAGSFLAQAPGEALMQGTTSGDPLDELARRAPEAHARLVSDLDHLEGNLGSAVEVEFAVERGELWYVQLRKFTPAPDSAELPAGSITVGSGHPASPGVGRGRLYTDVDDALDAANGGEAVLLALFTTAPADVPGIVASCGVMTVVGGRDCHAAVVARGASVPAVACVAGLSLADDHVQIGDTRIEVGDEVMIDGTRGLVAVAAVTET